MKTILFTYETPVGTFWIHPEPADRVRLGIDREKLKTYASARLAAKAVADRTTGWAPWDSLDAVPAPARLTAWKRPPRKGNRARAARADEDSEWSVLWKLRRGLRLTLIRQGNSLAGGFFNAELANNGEKARRTHEGFGRGDARDTETSFRKVLFEAPQCSALGVGFEES